MEPTDLLTKYASEGRKAAARKYAGDTGDLLKYLFTSPAPNTTPAHGHLAEAVRYTAFGDPVNAWHELRTGGPKKLLQNSFWHPSYGKWNALNYALPAAMTGMTYANMEPGTRSEHKGELVGSAVGGLLGGTMGQRFGFLGASALGAGGERLGRGLGQKLDNRLNSPKPIQTNYGVNNSPGTVPYHGTTPYGGTSGGINRDAWHPNQ